MSTTNKRWWTVLVCCILSLLMTTPAAAQIAVPNSTETSRHRLGPEVDNGLTLDVRTRGHVASITVTYDEGLVERGGGVIIDFGDGEAAPIRATRVNLSYTYEVTANPTHRNVRVVVVDAEDNVVAEESERFTTEAAYTLALSPLTVTSPMNCGRSGQAEFQARWAHGNGSQVAGFELGAGESHTVREFAHTVDNVTFNTQWRDVLRMQVFELDLFSDVLTPNGPTGEVVRGFADQTYVVTGPVNGCDSAFWSFEISLELLGG